MEADEEVEVEEQVEEDDESAGFEMLEMLCDAAEADEH